MTERLNNDARGLPGRAGEFRAPDSPGALVALSRPVGQSVKNHQVLRMTGFPAWGRPAARGPDSEGVAPAESQEMAIAALWGM